MPDGFVGSPAPCSGLITEVLRGLTAPTKTLPPKLFYDNTGCELFNRITMLPEYYPTRTEHGLLADIAATALAGLLPVQDHKILVEYGACDETKALHLLNQGVFSAYVPIDIAADELVALQHRLSITYKDLKVWPISADFLQPVALPGLVRTQPVLGFFPGSTIGNLVREEAISFLNRITCDLPVGSRLLVGVDLKKDPAILLPAYDDAAGVTASFNLNILQRLNREMSADFDLAAFRHKAVWNEVESRIEMHLVSQCRQTAHIEMQEIEFAPGETIHTENSYKYTIDDFKALARAAGWTPQQVWCDPGNLFSVHLLVTTVTA